MAGYIRKEKLRLQILDQGEEKEHFHQDVELIYVLEGGLDVWVEDHRTCMKTEDFLLINMGKAYRTKASGNVLYAKLSILYEMLRDILGDADVFFWCDSTRETANRYEKFRRLLRQLLKYYLGRDDKANYFGYISLCYKIMEELSVNFLVRASDREVAEDTQRFEDRRRQIDRYMYLNYDQPISIRDLSEKLFLSVGYLTRFFKKIYGVSFTEQLARIRLLHAVDELLYTDHPVTKIAYDNGFSNAAAFDKVFKKEYGEAPSAVRKKKRNDPPVQADGGTHNIKLRLEQLLWEDQIQDEEDENKSRRIGTVSARDMEPLHPFWKNTINIGSAAELIKSEVQEHIILLKSALNFEYMRFWNPFSRELLIDVNNTEKEYNFSKLDSVLDFLVRQGIRPHIELMSKPYRVQKNTREALVYEAQSTVDSLKKWEHLIHAFMKHIVRRYSVKEINTWRLELWYEESYLTGSRRVDWYFQVFDLVYRTVKGYCADMEVGGCGMQTFHHDDSYRSFMKEFLNSWSRERSRPDFISVMSYPYIMGIAENGWFSRKSTDSSFILHSFEDIKAEMDSSGLGDRKLYITEWNLTISERNHINDSCFKGAYIIRNYIELYGKAEEMAYFQGSDKASEYYDTNVLLYGGTGLISKDGILKPSGFAFDFLNRCYPFYLGKGSHYLVSTDGNGAYGIVCHNGKELNYNYYYTDEDLLEREHLSRYYEDKETLELELRIKDVENGIYQMKIYRINEQNGSALELWREMEYEKELSAKDIKYFRRLCEPKLTIQRCEAKNSVLKTEIRLAANEIAFIKLMLCEQ